MEAHRQQHRLYAQNVRNLRASRQVVLQARVQPRVLRPARQVNVQAVLVRLRAHPVQALPLLAKLRPKVYRQAQMEQLSHRQPPVPASPRRSHLRLLASVDLHLMGLLQLITPVKLHL